MDEEKIWVMFYRIRKCKIGFGDDEKNGVLICRGESLFGLCKWYLFFYVILVWLEYS